MYSVMQINIRFGKLQLEMNLSWRIPENVERCLRDNYLGMLPEVHATMLLFTYCSNVPRRKSQTFALACPRGASMYKSEIRLLFQNATTTVQAAETGSHPKASACLPMHEVQRLMKVDLIH